MYQKIQDTMIQAGKLICQAKERGFFLNQDNCGIKFVGENSTLSAIDI
jgi:hypothetical protein